MIQDRDHQLCEHHLDSLILGVFTESDFTWATIRLKSRALLDLYNQVVRVRELETYTIAAQRTLAKRQRQFIMQPVADSLSGRTVERRQTFDMLPDQAHTCQKE